VIGVSAFLHDSAAALVEDGHIRACAEEERFTRKKHDPAFPVQAMRYCLSQSTKAPDAVVYYERPDVAFERMMTTALETAPEGGSLLEQGLTAFFGNRAKVTPEISRLAGSYVPQLQVPHHTAHMASAFYPSPFERAAIVVLDGVGEWDTSTIGFGQDRTVTRLRDIRFPHSLGLLYAAFTYYCGFKINAGEYKLMGLAPFGEPIYSDLIRTHLVEVKPDGSFRLNLAYFGFETTPDIINATFEALFSQPRRQPENPILKLHADIAASIQAVTEDIVLRLTHTAQTITGTREVVFAGGVALNCVANGKVARKIGGDALWIQPAAGDAGGALGAALLVTHRDFELPRPHLGGHLDRQSGSLLGPEFTESQMADAIAAMGCVAQNHGSTAQCNRQIAALLARGNVVGVFRGRMEFGPRALGNRSILGDPRDPDMQARINQKIKFRESWRPFAAVVKADKAAQYFDLDADSPYMLLVTEVRAALHRAAPNDWWAGPEPIELGEVVRAARSTLPAVTHVNRSSRLQTVRKTDHSDLYDLLDAFEDLTDCPVLVNTSFNVRGEPIVCTPIEAIACFMNTQMDALVLGTYILLRSGQPFESAPGRVFFP
jgi:carbamoyltransferase